MCVRNFAAAVTASDCIVRRFDVPTRLELVMGLALGFQRPRRPVLGLTLAGVVVASVGKNVTKFKPGDQVYAFTEFRFGAYETS